MRKGCLFPALILMVLLCLPALTLAEDWSQFIVVEDEDLLPPDVSQQARALMSLMTDEERCISCSSYRPKC